jgi:hypothetical protein
MRTLAATLIALALCSTAAAAANYKNRSIDGRRFLGTCASGTYGTYRNVEIEFRGDRATVYISNGRLLLMLEDETILDPESIVGYDARRGIRWELSVRGLDSQ